MFLSFASPWGEIALWLVVVIVAVIIEIETVQMLSVWFAISGIISMLLAAFNCPFVAQIIVFVVLAAILLIVSRPIVKKVNARKAEGTSVESMVGEIVVVTKTIPLDGVGEIKTKYERFSAIAPEVNLSIEVDTKVKIKEIRGNKVIVELV